jgi:hypothetical protein
MLILRAGDIVDISLDAKQWKLCTDIFMYIFVILLVMMSEYILVVIFGNRGE